MLLLELLESLFLGLIVAIFVVVVLYGLAYWLQIAKFPKTKLKLQLYQSGETVIPRKRRYLERTFIWLSYFSTVHVLGFMLATLLVLGALAKDGIIKIEYPLVYFLFAAFAILTLARQIIPSSEMKA